MYIKKVSKNGQITIPREIQMLLDIHDGDYVSFDYKNSKIFIEKSHPDSYLNLCIFRYSKVTIPSEIRHYMKINSGDFLVFEQSNDKSKVYLKREISLSST